jgi:murein DD-endopeptidase MepM/ murein hydrolase activator NlpD
MGDHRAGVSGTAATELAAPASATSPSSSKPYVGRRIAQVPPTRPEVPRSTEALPYVGRRVAGRNPVVSGAQKPLQITTETAKLTRVGRRIALDPELEGDTAGPEDVVGHLLRPTAAPPTLDGYVGRRIARPADRIVIEPVPPTPCPDAVVEAAPILVEPAPVLVEPAPVLVEAAPVLVEPAPIVVEPAPIVVESAPILVEPAPILVESAPVVIETAPTPVEEPVEEPVHEPVEAAAEEAATVEATVEAADLVEPVLAVHPELAVEGPPPPAQTAKRTRPGGRRVASRRPRVPSLPLLAGVAVLAISAGGALQAVHPDLAGTEPGGRIAPAGALSGSSAVGSASVLGDRGSTVSRSADRTSGTDLQAAADAQAKERDAALSALAGAAEKQAAEIKLHQWVLPVAPGVYHLTAGFGEYSYLWSHFHTGLDFAAPTGTPIMAVAGGTITEVGYSGAYGNRTIETLPDGTELWYCHQNDFGTSVGDTVKPGQVIGYVGSTGNVTGSHLHLEVHPGGGDPVDPYTALQVHGLQP